MAIPEQPSALQSADVPAVVKSLLPLKWAIWFWQQARKIVILIVGMTVVLLGIAMLVLPGPGWLTIFAGLAVLATEFAWARWMLKHAKARLEQLMAAARNGFARPENSSGHSTRPNP